MKTTLTTVTVEHDIEFVGEFCGKDCHKYRADKPTRTVCGIYHYALASADGKRFQRCIKCIEQVALDREMHGRKP